MEKIKPNKKDAERFLLCVDVARLELTRAFLAFTEGDTLRARTQITGASDQILHAYKLMEKFNVAIDNIIGHVTEEPAVTPAGTIIETVDREDISEQVQRISIKQQVLDLIERKTGVLDKKEIETELPHIKDGSIRMALHELNKSGEIDRVGYGLYTRVIKLSSKEGKT